MQAQDQGGSPCGKPEEGSGASSGSGEGSGGGKGSMEGGTMVDEGLARTRLKEGAEEGGEISTKSRARAQKRKVSLIWDVGRQNSALRTTLLDNPCFQGV